jgi:hypothetical protein
MAGMDKLDGSAVCFCSLKNVGGGGERTGRFGGIVIIDDRWVYFGI